MCVCGGGGGGEEREGGGLNHCEKNKQTIKHMYVFFELTIFADSSSGICSCLLGRRSHTVYSRSYIYIYSNTR